MEQLPIASANITAPRNDGLDNGTLEQKHKVFLSHSGVQKEFVENLTEQLEGCSPFIDKCQNSLQMGEKFPKLDALQRCIIGVVILSEEYFTSKRPMMELVAMVDEVKKRSSFKMLIVFFATSIKELHDPMNHIRWQSYWHELVLEDKSYKIMAEKWEATLKYLQSIHGLEYDGLNELEFGKVVVDAICKILPIEVKYEDSYIQKRSRMCKLGDSKVIQNKIDVLKNDTIHGVYVVELYDMGGVEKTSICKALCNEYFTECCSNVCHVEQERMSELRDVMKKIFNKSYECLDGFNQHELKDGLNEGIIKEAIFLALDNMSDTDASIMQAKSYLSARLPTGSIVLVTARTRESLIHERPHLSEKNCMEMPELKIEEAKSLFIKSSNFERRGDDDGQLIELCLMHCRFLKDDDHKSSHYHPLALDVFGREFGYIQRNPKEWKAQLDKDIFSLSKDEQYDIFSILRLSFDSLALEEQLLYKNTALFAAENKWHDVEVYFEWHGMVHGFQSIDVLERAVRFNHMRDRFCCSPKLKRLKRKSLLKQVGDGVDTGTIGIHDLFREFNMAEIKAGKSKRRHWFCIVDKCNQLIETAPPGSWENVKRIAFLHRKSRNLERVDFAHFPNISVLMILGRQMEDKLELDFSGFIHLKSLEVSQSNLDKLVVQGLPKGLVFLRLGSSRSDWKPWSDSQDFVKHIECLRKLQYLELLCYGGGELPNMRRMVSLRMANFQGWVDVVTLTGLSSLLKILSVLDLGGCRQLRSCPGFEDLEYLQQFTCTGSENLERLSILEKLKILQKLDVSRCPLITEFPSFGDLVALEELNAAYCTKLSNLRDMHKLCKLHSLYLRCRLLEELPGFDDFIPLERHNVGNLLQMGDNPSLRQLTKLHKLDISGWISAGFRGSCTLPMLQSLVNNDLCRTRDPLSLGIEQVDHSGTYNAIDDFGTGGLHDTASADFNLSGRDPLFLHDDHGDHSEKDVVEVSGSQDLNDSGSVDLNLFSCGEQLSLCGGQINDSEIMYVPEVFKRKGLDDLGSADLNHFGIRDAIEVFGSKGVDDYGTVDLNPSKSGENPLFLYDGQVDHFMITDVTDVCKLCQGLDDCERAHLNLSKGRDLVSLSMEQVDHSKIKDVIAAIKMDDHGSANLNLDPHFLHVEQVDHFGLTDVINVCKSNGFDDCGRANLNLSEGGDLLSLCVEQVNYSGIRDHVIEVFESQGTADSQSADLNLFKHEELLSFWDEQTDLFGIRDVIDVFGSMGLGDCGGVDLDLSKSGDPLSLGIEDLDCCRSSDSESENQHPSGCFWSSLRSDSEFGESGTQKDNEGFSADSTASLGSGGQASAESHESCCRTSSNYAGRKRSAATVDEDDLISRIAPIVNKQIEDALKPLISALQGREDEQRHQEKLLEIEKRELALKREKMHLLTLLGAPSNACNCEIQLGRNFVSANFIGNAWEALNVHGASSAHAQHCANSHPAEGMAHQLSNASDHDMCSIYGDQSENGTHSPFQTSPQKCGNFCPSEVEGTYHPLGTTYYDDLLRAIHPRQWQIYPDTLVACPNCDSLDTEFGCYNNFNVNQPRHFCKNCKRYWTEGGTLLNVSVGAGMENKQDGSEGLQGENCAASALSFKQSQSKRMAGQSSPVQSPGSASSFGQESGITMSSPPYWFHQNERLPFQSYACSQGFMTPEVSAVGSSDPASTQQRRLQRQFPPRNGFEQHSSTPSLGGLTQDAVNLGVMQTAKFSEPKLQQLDSSLTCRSAPSCDMTSTWASKDEPERFFNHGGYPSGYNPEWPQQPLPSSQGGASSFSPTHRIYNSGLTLPLTSSWTHALSAQCGLSNVGYMSHPQMTTPGWPGAQPTGPPVSSAGQQHQPVSLKSTLGKRGASDGGRLDGSQLPAKALRTHEFSRSLKSTRPMHGMN